MRQSFDIDAIDRAIESNDSVRKSLGLLAVAGESLMATREHDSRAPQPEGSQQHVLDIRHEVFQGIFTQMHHAHHPTN